MTSFIRLTGGGWVNMANVTAIRPLETGDERPHYTLHGGADGRTLIGRTDAVALGTVMFDIIPAPLGWYLLRADRHESGSWHLTSTTPVLAFARGLGWAWEVIPADFLMGSDIANRTALLHEGRVYDWRRFSRHANVEGWLGDLAEQEIE